jgi:DNA-directed RNA polymerase subunit delta
LEKFQEIKLATIELEVFAGKNRNELSMIEVAHALLEQVGEVMDFSDLVNEIQVYLGQSDLEIREKLLQFYTDLNIDGSFISLGDNRWGLRSWYAIDEIDEALINVEDSDEEDAGVKKKKKKRVNAFINDHDDNAIDWNNDDVEDDDFTNEDEDDDLDIDDDSEDDEEEEIAAYDSDLSEVTVDDEGVEAGEELVDSASMDLDQDFSLENDDQEISDPNEE